MENITQKLVMKLVNENNLSSGDVVEMGFGLVGLSQAMQWVKCDQYGLKLSKPVLWMLYRMANDKSGKLSVESKPIKPPLVPVEKKTLGKAQKQVLVVDIPEPKRRLPDGAFVKTKNGNIVFNHGGVQHAIPYLDGVDEIHFSFDGRNFTALGKFSESMGSVSVDEEF